MQQWYVVVNYSKSGMPKINIFLASSASNFIYLVEWFADYPCPPGYINTGADFSREDGKYFACTPETYSYVLLTEEEDYSSYCYGLGGTNIRTGCCNGTCPSAPC
jgi:hypothetical protein